jgi:inner membrane protein
MPTVMSHAVAGAALGTLFRTPREPRYWLAGAVCAALPDVDVVAFWYGVPWGHVLAHRGLTHSLPFAAALATVAVPALFRGPRWDGHRRQLWLFLFLATASHGLLDALTDGGPGIAFLAPFDNSRHFFAWRPIPVSPLSVRRFLGERGVAVLVAELRWVWLPAAGLATIATLLRRRSGGRA